MISVKLFPTLDDRKVEQFLNFRDKARKQAVENALTLFFMSIGFVVTWIFILALVLWESGHGR